MNKEIDFRTDLFTYIDYLRKLFEEFRVHTNILGYGKHFKKLVVLDEIDETTLPYFKNLVRSVKEWNGNHHHIYVILRIIELVKQVISSDNDVEVANSMNLPIKEMNGVFWVPLREYIKLHEDSVIDKKILAREIGSEKYDNISRIFEINWKDWCPYIEKCNGKMIDEIENESCIPCSEFGPPCWLYTNIYSILTKRKEY